MEPGCIAERMAPVCPIEADTNLGRLIARRTAERRRLAEEVAGRAIAELGALGIDIGLIGSLARGNFMAHSDIDFLVRTPVAGRVRVEVESRVAAAIKDTGLPYDIIYLSDLTPEQAAAFSDG
jgi:predicted nucleotidyltransferase